MNFTLVIDEPSQTVWEVRSSLPRMAAGVGVGWLILTAALVFSPSPLRWWVIGGAALICLGIAVYLTLNTPLSERGRAERNPEGGTIQWEQRWALRRKPVVWADTLEGLAGFWVETRTFEETAGWTYSQSRLWVLLGPGQAMLLTAWGEPEEIRTIATSLSRVARRPLQES